MKKKKKELEMLGKKMFVFLLIACLICIVLMGVYIFKDKQEEKMNAQKHEQLLEEVVAKPEEGHEMHEIDFHALEDINEEVYAWICIPGTDISFPILQHEEENQRYYLTRDIYNDITSEGSVFSEYYNRKNFNDPNTILYGHNSDNIFGIIKYFAEQDYFDEHKEIYIHLPDRTLKYQIVSYSEQDDRHLLASYDFWDEETYEQYQEEIMNPRSMSAVVRKGVALSTDDKLLTLSTCTEKNSGRRRLLHAVLVESVAN